MRTVSKTFTLAKFEELNLVQQKIVLEKMRDINIDYGDWFVDLLNEIKEDLVYLGFVNPEIEFSGFANQGDGASFTAKFNIAKNDKEKLERLKAFVGNNGIKNFQKLAEELAFHDFKDNENEFTYEVSRISRHYSHENTISSDDEFLKDWSRRYSKEIYKYLEKQYEYLTSDEAVKDTIELNEYEFDIDTLKISSLD